MHSSYEMTRSHRLGLTVATEHDQINTVHNLFSQVYVNNLKCTVAYLKTLDCALKIKGEGQHDKPV